MVTYQGRAILTRYSANRSFKNKAKEKSHSLLRYDAVMSYTAELFENFMEYKQLIKAVQDIISNPTKYKGTASQSILTFFEPSLTFYSTR